MLNEALTEDAGAHSQRRLAHVLVHRHRSEATAIRASGSEVKHSQLWRVGLQRGTDILGQEPGDPVGIIYPLFNIILSLTFVITVYQSSTCTVRRVK